jgi:hypothetical protein
MKYREIVIGAIDGSPSEVEKSFDSAIKQEIFKRIEEKRAEVGANVLCIKEAASQQEDKEAVAFLDAEMKKLFPKQEAGAIYDRFGGFMKVYVYSSPKGKAVNPKEANKQEIQVTFTSTSGSKMWKIFALKTPYAKIDDFKTTPLKGSDPMDAAKKMLKWYTKGKESFTVK